MGSRRTPCRVPCAPRPVPHAMCSPRPSQPLRNLGEKAEKQPLGSAFPQRHLSSSLSLGSAWNSPFPKRCWGRRLSPGAAVMQGAKAVAEGQGCLAGLSPCPHAACAGLAARPPCFPLPFHSRPCTLPGWLTAAPRAVSGLPKRVLRGAGGGMCAQAGSCSRGPAEWPCPWV